MERQVTKVMYLKINGRKRQTITMDKNKSITMEERTLKAIQKKEDNAQNNKTVDTPKKEDSFDQEFIWGFLFDKNNKSDKKQFNSHVCYIDI